MWWDGFFSPSGASAFGHLAFGHYAVCPRGRGRPSSSLKGSLTECNLRDNELGVEGWTIIFNALRDSPTSKIAEWNLSDERLGPAIAKPLAEYLSVTASLTVLDVRYNDRLGGKGEALLQQALQGRSGFDLRM